MLSNDSSHVPHSQRSLLLFTYRFVTLVKLLVLAC